MSVNTSASSNAHTLSDRPGILSGPADFRGSAFFRLMCTSIAVTEKGVSGLPSVASSGVMSGGFKVSIELGSKLTVSQVSVKPVVSLSHSVSVVVLVLSSSVLLSSDRTFGSSRLGAVDVWLWTLTLHAASLLVPLHLLCAAHPLLCSVIVVFS